MSVLKFKILCQHKLLNFDEKFKDQAKQDHIKNIFYAFSSMSNLSFPNFSWSYGLIHIENGVFARKKPEFFCFINKLYSWHNAVVAEACD